MRKIRCTKADALVVHVSELLTSFVESHALYVVAGF